MHSKQLLKNNFNFIDTMKCAVCNKDFGSGEKCQHCGTDKFIALGEYEGYGVPENGSMTEMRSSNSPISSSPSKSISADICYKCGEIIPPDSKFCPICGQNLWVICPNCNKRYSSQYNICNNCGTDRIKYQKEQEEAKIKEQLEAERKKREEIEEQERKAREHEEWLKTPEGLQYLSGIEENKLKQEAKKLRDQLNDIAENKAYKTFSVMLLLSILFGMVLSVLTNPGMGIVCGSVLSVIPFILLDLLPTYYNKALITKWKQQHPQSIVNKYL